MPYDACDLALRYIGAGWSVIPARPGGKVPLVSWKEYQTHRPDHRDWKHWLGRYGPGVNLSLVTGRVSGVVAFDCDTPAARAHCLDNLGIPRDEPTLWEYVTPRPGRRLLFSIPRDLVVPGWKRDGLELLGEGGNSILPPSRTPRGAYTWKSYGRVLPPALPATAMTFSAHTQKRPFGEGGGAATVTFPGARTGNRNRALFRYACALVGAGVPWWHVPDLVHRANQKCEPPLPGPEVERIIQSCERYR